jgi:hypothetical protein
LVLPFVDEPFFEEDDDSDGGLGGDSSVTILFDVLSSSAL